MNSFVSTPPAWQATASDQSTSTGGELQTFQIPTREPVHSAYARRLPSSLFTPPVRGWACATPLANGPSPCNRPRSALCLTIQDEYPSAS